MNMNKLLLKKVGKNALVFLAPLVVLYLTFVIANMQDNFALSDFVPNNATVGAMVLYVLNVFLDFFRKFIAK